MDALKRLVRGSGGSAPRPRRARRGPRTRLLSATGSIIVHALLLVALAAVVWRTSSAPMLAGGSDVVLDLTVTGLAEASSATVAPEAVAEAGRPHEVALRLEPESAPPPDPGVRVEPIPSLVTARVSAPAPPRETSAPGVDFQPGLPTDAASGATPAAPIEVGALGSGGVVFAGLGTANTRSVVYAVDASGSMVTSLRCVIEEVERSVSRLSPTQKFGVVLFRRPPGGGGGGVEVFSPVLVRATPSARERLGEWLRSIEPSGRSVLLAGLERALAYRPDAVFLLSRAIERSGGAVWESGGLEPTLRRIDALNAPGGDGRRPVVIQTLQFLDDDPTGTMQEIGRIHGARSDASGRALAGYRVVRGCEDLGVERPPARGQER